MVFPYEGAPSVNIADGRSVSLTQQTCMLKVSALTPWGQVSVRLAVAVLPGGDDVLILGSKTLREQLNINVMDGLMAKVMGPGIPGAGGQEELARRLGGHVSIRLVSLALDAVQEIVDLETAVGEEDESRTDALLARGPAMVMEPENERGLRLEAPQAALARVADEGMPPVKLHQL